MFFFRQNAKNVSFFCDNNFKWFQFSSTKCKKCFIFSTKCEKCFNFFNKMQTLFRFFEREKFDEIFVKNANSFLIF